MKKLIAIAIGLGLVLGTVSFAQVGPAKAPTGVFAPKETTAADAAAAALKAAADAQKAAADTAAAAKKAAADALKKLKK